MKRVVFALIIWGVGNAMAMESIPEGLSLCKQINQNNQAIIENIRVMNDRMDIMVKQLTALENVVRDSYSLIMHLQDRLNDHEAEIEELKALISEGPIDYSTPEVKKKYGHGKLPKDSTLKKIITVTEAQAEKMQEKRIKHEQHMKEEREKLDTREQEILEEMAMLKDNFDSE